MKRKHADDADMIQMRKLYIGKHLYHDQEKSFHSMIK